MKEVNRFALSDADYDVYSKCEMQVWNEHPRNCVCGKLATFSHERTCSKYRKTVDRLFVKTMKSLSKERCK